LRNDTPSTQATGPETGAWSGAPDGAVPDALKSVPSVRECEAAFRGKAEANDPWGRFGRHGNQPWRIPAVPGEAAERLIVIIESRTLISGV
jgi:hypothetical protein